MTISGDWLAALGVLQNLLGEMPEGRREERLSLMPMGMTLTLLRQGARTAELSAYGGLVTTMASARRNSQLCNGS